jgi:hypothetical protein
MVQSILIFEVAQISLLIAALPQSTTGKSKLHSTPSRKAPTVAALRKKSNFLKTYPRDLRRDSSSSISRPAIRTSTLSDRIISRRADDAW